MRWTGIGFAVGLGLEFGEEDCKGFGEFMAAELANVRAVDSAEFEEKGMAIDPTWDGVGRCGGRGEGCGHGITSIVVGDGPNKPPCTSKDDC
jgi:hypothetical protein